jgi:hypothetical protein
VSFTQSKETLRLLGDNVCIVIVLESFLQELYFVEKIVELQDLYQCWLEMDFENIFLLGILF